MEAQARIRALTGLLNEFSYRYYVQHAPAVTDVEYDALYRELQELEAEHPELIAPDSPTQRAGSDLSQDFQKVPHIRPVLSLANAFSDEDLATWQTRNRRLQPEAAFAYTIEPKFDGLTLVLTYEQGVLVQAATRGNGVVGDDVTASARTIHSVPLRIPVADAPPPPPLLVVRGEVLFTKEAFAALNRARIAAGEPAYVNARNTASGSLKQKDARLTAQRDLTLYVYDILHADGPLPASRFDRLNWLHQAGFLTPADAVRVHDLDAVSARAEWWKKQREKLPYEIDGLVVKVDDIELEGLLGVTGKDPRGAIALKFPSEQVGTRLVAVRPQIGRTGRITPTAHLAPVFVGGATVSRATLHNYDQIAQLDIRIGDMVTVKRSGDVIPYVVGPIAAMRTGREQAVAPPEICLECGDPVERREGFVDLFCPNAACPERVFQKVSFFASKGAMDIEGLGPKTLHQLISEELITDEADLFALKAEQLLPLERFAERKTNELLKSIDQARTRPLHQILMALGIPGVGGVMAKLLLESFNSLETLAAMASKVRSLEAELTAQLPPMDEAPLALALRHAHLKSPETAIVRKLDELFNVPQTSEQVLGLLRGILKATDPLLAVEGIGHILVERVIRWFSDPQNMRLLEKLKAAGLGLEQTAKSRASAQLAGLTFVITGTLPFMSRAQARSLIEDHGGKVTGSVSRRTSYLVAGTRAGSKLTRAQQLEIPVLGEEALRQLIKDGNT